ncbi:MAG: sugar phosphate isomerase/epimerase [Oscillospiraceae bacterium]|jgi:sugar phosphate isomerase/epimerase|nr:sugar phosphate isomerase/epimerase [Oscillospiraceae bacterium]
MKIATFADWFGVGLIGGIKESMHCGAEGVQLYAWNELNPFEITPAKITEIKQVAKDCGQAVTALCGELAVINPGGHGFEDESKNPSLIDYVKRVFDIAAELGCNVVTTHVGIIPEDENGAKYKALQSACMEISEYAKKLDAWLAIETGPETVAKLCSFTDSIPDGRIAINYDPANLVMVTNDDEVKGVLTAGKRIVHTHAKDGIMNKYIGPIPIYTAFAEGGTEILENLSDYFVETPLGEGSVRWPEYLGALQSIGYNGYLTIEREVGKDAAKDIILAVGFLKEQLGAL